MEWRNCFLCLSEIDGKTSSNLSSHEIVLKYLLNGDSQVLCNTSNDDGGIQTSNSRLQSCESCNLRMEHIKELHTDLEAIQLKMIEKLKILREKVLNSSKLYGNDEMKKIWLGLFETWVEKQEGRQGRRFNENKNLLEKLYKFQSAVYDAGQRRQDVPLRHLNCYSPPSEEVPNEFTFKSEPVDSDSEPEVDHEAMDFSMDEDPMEPQRPETPDGTSKKKRGRGRPGTVKPINPADDLDSASISPKPTKLVKVNIIQRNSDAKVFKCDDCDVECTTKAALTEHCNLDHGGNVWKCSMEDCGLEYGNEASLKKHYQRKHTATNLVCDHCGSTFTSKEGYYKHMKIHKNLREHVCQQCGRSFNLRTYLVNHMRTHSSEKKFVCECGKKFKQYPALYLHRKLKHSGEPSGGPS